MKRYYSKEDTEMATSAFLISLIIREMQIKINSHLSIWLLKKKKDMLARM